MKPEQLAGLLATLFLMSCGADYQNTEDTSAVSQNRPNILLVIGDDMGFSDLGAYGSEVSTPNLDAIAAEGLQFTNFHVGANCSPTRALLMSGVDNHRNGVGNMREFLTPEQRGRPGYEGYLNKQVVSISNLLRDSGYRTFLAGKWHLGSELGYRPFNRGFEHSFALMQGAGDNWGSISGGKVAGERLTFTSQGEIVKRPAGIHSNQLYSDKMIEFIAADQGSSKPFFAYLSFQTAHWPHQAPKEFVEKYRSVYKAGWDSIRERRIDRLRQLNIISQDHPTSPRFPIVPAWNTLSNKQQQIAANRMAGYSGMIEHMDHNLGRVIQYLKDSGEYENTIVIFISDNGPDRSQPYFAGKDWYDKRYPKTSVDDVGLRGSFSSYGPGWAQVSAAHLSGYKTFTTEGGLRVPLLIRYPKEFITGRTDEFAFVTDLSATLLDIAEIRHPGTHYKGREIAPMTAKSFLPLLRGETLTHRSAEDWVIYELMGNSAVFRGDYKALRLGTWMTKAIGAPDTGAWRLYNLKNDPSELHDLSSSKPKLMDEFTNHYETYANEMGIVSMPADFDPVKIITRGRRG